MSKHAKAADPAYPVDRIVDSVKGFVGEAESLLRMTAEFSSDSIDAVKGEFEKKLRNVKETLGEVEKTTLKRYRDVVRGTDNYVHESPWSAIGIAMAFGVLVGYLGHRPGVRR